MGHYWGAIDPRKSLDSGTVMGLAPVEGGCQGDGEQDDCTHENDDVSPKIGSGLLGLHIGLPETERLGGGPGSRYAQDGELSAPEQTNP